MASQQVIKGSEHLSDCSVPAVKLRTFEFLLYMLFVAAGDVRGSQEIQQIFSVVQRLCQRSVRCWRACDEEQQSAITV